MTIQGPYARRRRGQEPAELWPLVHGAVEDPEDPEHPEEAVDEGPVWLVRAVIVLFLVAFAAYLGREVQRIAECWPC